jgi:hypothetical protein
MGCPTQNRTIGTHRFRLKIILKYILEKWDGTAMTGLTSVKILTVS